MAYELHVFIGRDGDPWAALTLPNGHRTAPRKLNKRHRAVLRELRVDLELYDRRKGLRRDDGC
jgi:hypothetical protein